jgi:hypothetical protein
MRINKLIIITIMLFALLICVDVANAVTFTDNFDNTNAWVKTGGGCGR